MQPEGVLTARLIEARALSVLDGAGQLSVDGCEALGDQIL